MGKRGPRSKVTQDIVEIIKQRYHGGASHRAIADELKISETNIRRILSQHSIPKRDRKLATLLSAAEEDTLVEFLISQKNFRGKYRDLRDLMENFARERGEKKMASLKMALN
jgi:ribosome-binding protein aMBF1 (putative translation factor)